MSISNEYISSESPTDPGVFGGRGGTGGGGSASSSGSGGGGGALRKEGLTIGGLDEGGGCRRGEGGILAPENALVGLGGMTGAGSEGSSSVIPHSEPAEDPLWFSSTEG